VELQGRRMRASRAVMSAYTMQCEWGRTSFFVKVIGGHVLYYEKGFK
jgi:hypothetical protein